MLSSSPSKHASTFCRWCSLIHWQLPKEQRAPTTTRQWYDRSVVPLAKCYSRILQHLWVYCSVIPETGECFPFSTKWSKMLVFVIYSPTRTRVILNSNNERQPQEQPPREQEAAAVLGLLNVVFSSSPFSNRGRQSWDDPLRSSVQHILEHHPVSQYTKSQNGMPWNVSDYFFLSSHPHTHTFFFLWQTLQGTLSTQQEEKQQQHSFQ